MDPKTKTRLFWAALVVVAVVLAAHKTRSEIVQVKYRGEVNVAPFDCTNIDGGSFVERVCYDKANQYMLIDLRGTYYHYCEIDSATVSSLLQAESLGQFYNATIKGRFDCRTHRVPQY